MPAVTATSARKSLSGKVALVTGAARGIGAETARLMAAHGASVIVADVLTAEGLAVAQRINEGGGSARYVALDVAQEQSWEAAIAVALERFGNLDILVNNAGVFLGRDFMEASLDEWHRLVAVNLTGVFLGTRVSAPAFAESGANSRHGSAIVNVSSIAGLVGSPLDPLYSMTKGGVTLFTKSTALAFGHKGMRIRVNAIHPGVIETDMGEQTFAARARQDGGFDATAARAAMLARHPIGRLGTMEDVAAGIVFLASDDAGFVTGASLVVDGGLTAQ